MQQKEYKEFQSFVYTWTIRDCANPDCARSSPVFKDTQNNEWQLEYHSTSTFQSIRFTLCLKKMGVCVGLDGKLEAMVKIFASNPSATSNGLEVSRPSIQEFEFSVMSTKYTRAFSETCKAYFLEMLSKDKALTIQCQIWTLKPVGQYDSGSLSSQQKVLFEDALFPDVNIYVEGTVIPAHKAILAGRSIFFRKMFETKMLESLENQATIEGFSVSVVRGMLEFIYTDQTTINLEDGEEWLRIADMCELTNLKTKVDSMLLANLNAENAVQAFRWALHYKRPELKVMASTFIKRNWTPVVFGDGIKDFANADPEGIVELLQSISLP